MQTTMATEPDITFGPLQPDQWQDYRDIWLEALREMPEAFPGDYNQQKDQPDHVWQQRLQTALEEKDVIIIFAKVEEKPIGFLAAFMDDNQKFAHYITIWGTYVQSAYRNQGVAKYMMKKFIQKVEALPQIIKIKTFSVTSETMAVSLYKNFSFEIAGISKKEMKIDDTYIDVYLMEKYLPERPV